MHSDVREKVECVGERADGGGRVVEDGTGCLPATDALRGIFRRVRWHLGLALFVLVALPVMVVPRRLAVAFGGMTGLLAYRLLGKVRRTTVENIRNSLPYLATLDGWNPACGAPEEIARRTFANFGRTFVEVLKLYFGQGEGLMAGVEIRGLEHYEQARARGKGIILITGHCGNWELMALTFGLRHSEMSVVARRQKYDPLTGFLERLRHRFGNSVIYADGAARRIFLKLRKNGIVGILIDQAVPESEGAVVDFLGRGAWTTTMPPLVAAKTGASLLPMFIHREGGRHVVTIHPAVQADAGGDPLAGTRALNRAIEGHIARHPDEWLWVYRRWKRT